MDVLLDGLLDKEGGEEAERDEALAVAVEELDGVDDLVARDVDADDAEVVGEAVADKDAAAVDEVAQLEVDVLERHEAPRRRRGVEVARRDAREAREVVDDGLGDEHVVVDERAPRGLALPKHARHARDAAVRGRRLRARAARAARARRGVRAVELAHGPARAQRHKLRVDRDRLAALRQLRLALERDPPHPALLVQQERAQEQRAVRLLVRLRIIRIASHIVLSTLL